MCPVFVPQLHARRYKPDASYHPRVPDDQKDAIFGKGERGLDSAGMVIGLYLVDTLVTSYGGTVWVEDNDPEGLVFVVELPETE